MSEPNRPSIIRRCDVAVVGASTDGLAAALHLARQRRSVIVVDEGSCVEDDRTTQTDSTTAGREQVRANGGEVLAGRAERVTRADEVGLRVGLVGGNAIVARRVLATAGSVETEPDMDDLPGLYPIGKPSDPSHQMLHPPADGARVGVMIADDLADEELASGPPRPANEIEWDRRYGDEQVWSGNPNGTLVEEVAGLTPGRAFEVGAGEGGDSLWLAERGWTVVATDISQVALDRLGTEAARRGIEITLHRSDANTPDGFGPDTHDLVVVCYPAIPHTGDGQGIANLLDAVAPGGTLLMVGHDPEPMRDVVGAGGPTRGWDVDAFVQVEDLAAVVGATPGWEIEVNEKRPRPVGSATHSHHPDDVVLRAQRTD